MKPKKTTYTATEARKNFFDILNRVLYGDEEIYVKKNGADGKVRIGKASVSKKEIEELAGSISKEDVDIMEKAIKDAKKVPERKFENPFD